MYRTRVWVTPRTMTRISQASMRGTTNPTIVVTAFYIWSSCLDMWQPIVSSRSVSRDERILGRQGLDSQIRIVVCEATTFSCLSCNVWYLGSLVVCHLPLPCYHISMKRSLHPVFSLRLGVVWLFLPVLSSLMISCMPVGPMPITLMPTLAPTVSSTSTPVLSPTPTVTPVPPHVVNIRWPERASALEPVTIKVDVQSPRGFAEELRVSAILFNPENVPVWSADLVKGDGGLYYGQEPVVFSLLPNEGDWRLQVYVQSSLRVEGELSHTFQPSPIAFRELSGTLPTQASMLVPEEFDEELALGDQVAGARVWRYGEGEVSVWWAPGPTEPLLLNTAIVMLEATFDPEASPRVLNVEENQWAGQRAFVFTESWPEAADGPAEAWVIQGPEYWLYVLRVRPVGTSEVPSLLQEIRDTFMFQRE